MGGMPLASGDAVVAWRMGQESDSGAFVVTRPGEGKLRKWTKTVGGPANANWSTALAVPHAQGWKWHGFGRALVGRTLGLGWQGWTPSEQ